MDDLKLEIAHIGINNDKGEKIGGFAVHLLKG